jgi:hypothetical protein
MPAKTSSGQDLPIRFLTEPDQKGVTQPNRRRFQIAGWAEQHSDQLVVGELRFLHVDDVDLLAAADDNALDRLRQGQCLIASFLDLRCVGDLVDVPVSLLKEPLSLLAACSAFAMVHPVDCASHQPPPILRGETLSILSDTARSESEENGCEGGEQSKIATSSGHNIKASCTS